MIPPPLEPCAVPLWRTHIVEHMGWKYTGDGAGARLQQEMFVATRTQHPASWRDAVVQEVVG